MMTVDELKRHVEGCSRCRNALRIGKLCSVGRRGLEDVLLHKMDLPYRGGRDDPGTAVDGGIDDDEGDPESE